MDPVINDLVKIKEVAIEYLTRKKPLNWKIHVEELQRGAVMKIEGTYRIGIWIYDRATMTLIRDAEMADEVRRYGMIFKRDDEHGFVVVKDFWESESFN